MKFLDLARLADRRPWHAHLYVTDQCNLDCHYCNEYDNSIPHPPLDDVKKWMAKIRELGVLRLGLQGGEPLLHPDIVEIVRYGRELGFLAVNMTTNGFLLTRELVRDLDEAGLGSMQISVDRMTPIPSTRKSFKTVAHKLDYFKDSGIRLGVGGVLFEDTLEEMEEVLTHSFARGVRAQARIVHDDMVNDEGVTISDRQPFVEFLNREAQRKANGEPMHTSWSVLEYQKAKLENRPFNWTCIAGYKYFFVSARGKFWLCSQVRTDRDLLDMTPADLRAYDHKKECQDRCGVYCIIQASLRAKDTIRFYATEARGKFKAKQNGRRHVEVRRQPPSEESVPITIAPVVEDSQATKVQK